MALQREEKLKLAHLLRRAGFGARPDEWAGFESLGLEGTKKQLLHPESVPDHLDGVLNSIAGDFIDFDEIDSVRRWWVYRMVHSRRQLEEKMVLFWHDHFATGNYKVNNSRLMWRQNEMFRTHALGNFRSMLHAVARDPAMLIWLDGDANRNGAPNENFARELMELFSMGVDSGYTEKDVQESARCFTGWRHDYNENKFVFATYLHDDGGKTILGETGNFHGDDVVDLVAAHPATARYLSTKLWKFFVNGHPSESDIKALSTVYFKSGYDIRSVVGAIFDSPVFYSDAAMYANIKSPVEFAVQMLRTLGAPMSSSRDLFRDLSGMGQDLFNPPDVAGWRQGQAWINTRTLLSRIQFASSLAYESSRRTKLADNLKKGPLDDPGAKGFATPEVAVDALWDALMPGRAMEPRIRNALIASLKKDVPEGEVRFDDKLPGLLDIIVSTPEYQLV